MMKRYFLFLIVLAVSLPSVQASEQPGIRFAFDTGATDNLFFDSLATGDKFISATLDLELPINPEIFVFYNQKYSGYAEYFELESFDHVAGVNFSKPWKNNSTFYLEFGGDKRLYHTPYELYDRNGLFVGGGARYDLSQKMQLRVEFDLSNSVYPEYFVSPGIDYQDFLGKLGSNFTLGAKNAVDLELGIHQRTYSGLKGPETTLFTMRTRISRPLNRYTGLALFIAYHNQLDPGTRELFTFYARGVNVHEHLWDGWDSGVTLTRFMKQWKIKARLAYRKADFVEIPVVLETRLRIPQRSDNALSLNLDARRVLTIINDQIRVWGYTDFRFERNLSTVPYYEYDSNELHAGIIVEW